MSQRPIYLDAHATTPVDERVLNAMLPYFTEHFGNPSTNTHLYGWEASAAVKNARETIANIINATPEEIVFTSGATEANNLAIKGVAEAYFDRGKHIITVATEHRAVLNPCQYLETLGFEVTYLPVLPDGLLDLQKLTAAIREDTILVSVMAANNEIGVLQPLAAIGEICHSQGILFHTDAAQAIAKIPLDVAGMKIDLMSLTAHKIYGPKGVGALYVRRRDPRVKIAPQLQGGGQERGRRSGTLYTPQIVGFAKAITIGVAEMQWESKRLLQLKQQLWSMFESLDGVYLNGNLTTSLQGNLNISIEGVDGSALLLALQSVVAVSSGSACAATSTAPSHVLTALGREEKLARASLRFGIGRFNTPEEIAIVGKQAIAAIKSLRQANQS
ncbi:aminotransferase class V-fold PLP-dependent enzyme [Waterburya agarophytonicola K14]|uniref:cysteine desulfurase n=1 Tax=Waterburya agarophytonicola KI4 TaxID=2874699 RepID=A0A964BNH6_9CYAN|nr:aminotransferase class V-fold PLP-dependent enzyme [Waterburya agarophytonicola]MCC0175598.1 aminotransferase class V-fold PLP-dependent enzyme [Waterburya agarophytonicola KI4]